MRTATRTHYQNHLRKHFLMIATAAILFISIVGNLSVRYFFAGFLNDQIQENNQQILSSVEALLLENAITAQNIRALSASNNVYLKIINDSDSVVVETTSTMGHGMGYGRNSSMSAPSSTPLINTDNLNFQQYSLFQSSGYTLEIGRSKDLITNDIEANFLFALNIVFITAFVIAALFSIFYAYYQAKKITTPISKLIHNTHQIEQAHYQKFTPIETELIEIDNLNASLANLNAKLQNQEALRKRLSTDIAHELRNPLSILRSHIEAFVDGVWAPDEEKLLKCNDEVLRLTRLIDELNELSSIENSLSLKMSEHDMVNTVSKVISSFDLLLEEHHLQLETNFPKQLIMVYDEDRMIQVYVNLLSNAIKYSKPNTTIYLSLNPDKFSIQDEGIGISSSDLPYIFERFYRSDSSRSRKTGGLGIGLAVVKTVCDAHDYSISASSEFNLGTTFLIEF